MAAYVAYQFVSAEPVVPYTAIDSVIWYGSTMSRDAFALLSVVGFLAWTVVGIHRLLRLELQEENRPWIWLGFLIYVALSNADFGAGAVAGLSMAFIAMITDRIIQSWSHKKKIELGLA